MSLCPITGGIENYKVYDYTSIASNSLSLVKTIGVQHGYLDTTTGVAGSLSTNRFCGPHSIAIDTKGNIYTGEAYFPGGGTTAWSKVQPVPLGCRITKQNASGVQQWTTYSLNLGEMGCPTTDGSRYYDSVHVYDLRNTSTSPP